MGSLQTCIQSLADQGIDPKLIKQINKHKDPDDLIKSLDDALSNVEIKKQKQAKDFKLRKTLNDDLQHLNDDEKFDYISNLITKSKGGMKKTKNNIEIKIKEIHGKMTQPLAKHFDELRSKFAGLQVNTKLFKDITKGIYLGEKSIDDPIVKSIIKAMNESLEVTNKFAVEAGETVINQLHKVTPLNVEKIQGMDEETFIKKVSQFVTDDREAIRKTYNDVMNLDEEVAELNFKDYENMLAYQDLFGVGDPFSNLIKYIDKQAAKVAAQSVLGNNPRSTLKGLINKGNFTPQEKNQLEYMYNIATGTAKTKIHKNKLSAATATALSSLRGLSTAAMLGSSMVVALLDSVTMKMLADVNGLPKMKMYSELVQNLASKNKRMELSQLGFQLESVLDSLTHSNRFNVHSAQSDFINKASTFTLRASGLIAWSDATKMAVKNTFLTTFKDYSKLSFGDLITKNPKFAASLKRYNINEKEWDTIRKSIKEDDILLNPMNLDDSHSSLVYRLVNEEAEYAVVTPGARSNYWTSLGTDKGSLIGETVRDLTQFKSTIVEQITTVLARGAQLEGINNQFHYWATYIVGTTVLGGMIAEIKEVTKGNTPINPNEKPVEFLGSALKEGGAVPIVSDLLDNLMQPSYGADFVSKQLSPASLSLPIRHLNNIVKMANEDPEKAERARQKELATIIQTIPGNNIWYIKALSEYIKHMVGMLLNPKEQRRIDKKRKKKLKENGQSSAIL